MHLHSVVKIAYLFNYLIKPEDYFVVICACYCHDLIEDCRVSYNDLKIKTSEKIADIVYDVTSEKGKNRNERNNEKFYNQLKLNDLAIFVKLCDRIANIMYSKSTKSSMFKKYKQEYDNFKSKLFTEKYEDMFKFLEEKLQDD